MPYIEVAGNIPENLNSFQSYQIYNCLDCALTSQLDAVLSKQMTPEMTRTYQRTKRVQQLCLEISTGGFPVDQLALAELLYDLEKDRDKITDRLHSFCLAIDSLPFNPNSPKQVTDFFYKYLGLPTIYKFDFKTKKRTPSTDVKALEKLRLNYPIAAPFVQAILGYREVVKMLSVFKKGLEPKTKKLRCNFTPTGTETGRLSSQANPYQRGSNAQNLTNRVRQVFKAPEGFCFVNIDLKTAESIAVGFISGSVPYIEACIGKLQPDGTRSPADLHTTVATMNWTELPWTGNIFKDKKTAESPYYRHFTYRDMAKRGGHGTNYYGKAATMAKHLKLPSHIVQTFQDGYFRAFPEIPEWHLSTIAQIQQTSKITTALGRVRQFWGRPSDAATHREAIAYHPQSLVGDVMNEGLLQVLDWAKRAAAPIELIAQVHDSGLFIVPIKELEHLAAEILKHQLFPVDFGNLGVMQIPSDLQVGLTWCKKPKSGGNAYERVGLVDYEIGQELHF